MIFLIVLIITLYTVLIVWTYYNLNGLKNIDKIKYLIIGIILNFLISIFQIISIKTNILNDSISSVINKVNIAIFSPINALLSMPMIANIINRYKLRTIRKEQAKRKILIYLIIFILIILIETQYIKGLKEMINQIIINR